MLKRSNPFDKQQQKKKRKFTKLLHLSHEQVLELLQEFTNIISQNDIDEFIRKQPISETTPSTTTYPSNAINGQHLISTCFTLMEIFLESNSLEQSQEEATKLLIENNVITNTIVASKLTRLLLENYTKISFLHHNNSITVKQLFSNNIKARIQKRLLLATDELYMPFLVDEHFIETISSSFSLLLKANDKQSVTIPFMACAPGSGKSRSLQEIFVKTEQGIQFKENSLEILISFSNTTSMDSKEDFKSALCRRVLYSYLDIQLPFQEFKPDLGNCEFITLLKLIADHWRETHSKPSSEVLYIYLGIDEFTQLSTTYLSSIISLIGNCIINLKDNVRILPFFAGLNQKEFEISIEESSYNCKLITPYKFTEIDEQEIVKKYFPTLYNNKELWKVMIYCNRQPRLIAWLIREYQRSSNLKEAYEETQRRYLSGYRACEIDENIAKFIFASVITQLPLIIDSNIIRLEERGWISFNVEEGNIITAFTPFPILVYCANMLTDFELGTTFVKLLENYSWESKTSQKDFEKFNAIFDCVLNRCFLYLGKTYMTIEERFRGVKFGKTQTSNIELEKCPMKYVEMPLKFSNAHPEEITELENGSMVLNSLEECFFNRLMKANINHKNYIILWQDKETFWDLSKFDQESLEQIMDKHFTKQKLATIKAEPENCLSIIITTKLNTAVKYPDNFGYIDSNGLTTYYGKYVHQLFSLQYNKFY